MTARTTTIGVLALQGSFSEHLAILESLPIPLTAIPVRTAEQLAQCSGLIIPGGESTTMSLVAQRGELLEPLREYVRDARQGKGKSVWGTCAGMILLGKECVGGKVGYKGLDGIDYKVVRNQWGRQAESFSDSIDIPCLSTSNTSPSTSFQAIFIRAPVLHSILPSAPGEPEVQVLARVPRSILPTPTKAVLAAGGCELGPDADVVMLRQGNLLATSFHPELTGDTRVCEYWVKEMVLAAK